MKKITLLFFAVITFGFGFQSYAQCNYTLEMNDSYGDGWNGNTMDVLVNGTNVLTGVGLAGGSQGTMTFPVNDGDDVTTNWIGGGSFGYETSYRILNSTGVEVGTGAESSITTGTITASCPTCTQVVVNSETVMPDCGNSQFSVDVDVASVGDGTVITDGLGGSFAVAAGIVTAGPYATSSTVTLTVEHSDPACNFSLGDFSYIDCPTTVMCGTPVNTTYCYGDNDTRQFVYTSNDGSALSVTFNAGGIESCCDDLVVYDSDGTTEIYRGANGGDLAGLTFNSTGDTITVAVDSDVSSSCDSGAQSPQWDWDVTCLACSPAVASVAIVPDCGGSTYTLDVTVSDTGDATSITDGTTPQAIAASLTFGPYAFGVDITLDVVHTDSACDYTLGTYSYTACPPTNDDCASAEVAPVGLGSCGTSVTGHNIGATDSGVAQAGCATATYSGGDVWYTFVMPAGETEIEYTRSASVFSTTQVELYSGTCGALVEEGCTTAASASFTGLTSGATYYLRIYDWGNNDFGSFTFCLNTPPTCPVPTSLTATNITTTSADLGWTEAGTATTWDIEWGTNGFTPTGTPNIVGTTTNPHNLGSFSASTSYDFYVRADCGGDMSPWAGPYTFVTADPPPACGGNFYDDGGISSNYSSSANITTTICPDVPGDAVNVTFTFFSTENSGNTACYDGLTIHDGADISAPTINPTTGTIWCWDRNDATPDGTGDLQGMTITSTDASGCLTFVFTSDSSVTREGWEATIGCAPLSLEDYGLTGFTYFPNPVNNTLSLRGVKDIQDVAVYNMLGQEVLRTAPNTVASDIDMSSLQTGTYFVKVMIENTTKTIKVIKK